MEQSKKATIEKLAKAHYSIEPGITHIFRIEAEREDESSEPVKLLEVNQDTLAEGISPVFFGAVPGKEINHSSMIVEVTPAEFQQIKSGTLRLPHGWRLGPEIARAAATVR